MTTFKPIQQIATLLALSLILIVTGCSNSQTKPKRELADVLGEMELQQGETMERIRDYRVNGWQYIDYYNLIISAGVKEQYLISLRTPCPELNSAFSIGFTSRTGTLDKFEDIIVKDRFTGSRRCGIADIVKLEKLEQYPEGKPPEDV